MRKITPNIFGLRISIIALLVFSSIVWYLFLVKPVNWLRESLFVSAVMTGLALVITLIFHGLIEHNLNIKNFVVSLIASVIPFICGGLYGALSRTTKSAGGSLS